MVNTTTRTTNSHLRKGLSLSIENTLDNQSPYEPGHDDESDAEKRTGFLVRSAATLG